MTRRELFAALSAAAAATGLPALAESNVQAHEAPIDPARTFVSLRTDRPLSVNDHLHITDAWRKMTHGTPWEGVQLMVLDRGTVVEVHSADVPAEKVREIAREVIRELPGLLRDHSV